MSVCIRRINRLCYCFYCHSLLLPLSIELAFRTHTCCWYVCMVFLYIFILFYYYYYCSTANIISLLKLFMTIAIQNWKAKSIRSIAIQIEMGELLRHKWALFFAFFFSSFPSAWFIWRHYFFVYCAKWKIYNLNLRRENDMGIWVLFLLFLN